MSSTPTYNTNGKGWDLVDAVLYINLEHRVDRREHLLGELERMGVPQEKIVRVDAVRRDIGALGCTLSHMKAFDLIMEKGWSNVLVLEDDFTWMPDVGAEQVGRQVGELLSAGGTKGRWDVVQISWNPSGRIVGAGRLPWLRRAVGVRTTSGYFVRGGFVASHSEAAKERTSHGSSDFVEELRECFADAAATMERHGWSAEQCCDMRWQELQHENEWYVAYPPLGYQMDGWSDVEGKDVSYGC
jgi:glycosyl transferase family 25